MEQMKFHQVELAFEEQLLFKDVNVSIQEREVIGVIGRNGSGKSTLLQLISGHLSPTKGHIERVAPILVQFVEQEAQHYKFSYSSIHKKWGIPENAYEQLSGGEKLKVRLADGFAAQADLLLLDEPSNHLDEHALERLIKEIRSYSGTIIVVSHDRFFLDKAATTIWSIEGHSIYAQKGNYSHYQEVRKLRRQTQQAMYDKQQDKIQALNKQINELTTWSSKAHKASTKQEGFKEYYRLAAKRMDAQVKSRRKRLEKELGKDKVEAPDSEHEVYFEFQSQARHGKRMLLVDNLMSSYGQQPVLKGVTFQCALGDRIAITGGNGSGKTTLLRCILGQQAISGSSVWLSPSAKAGYLTQEVHDLPLTLTPAELTPSTSFEQRSHIQTVFDQLGFHQEQWKQQIGTMSMGERVKLKLMQYLLEDTNLLILDEPTNHLDLPSREQLEHTLAQYTGALLVVSHDRYFRNKVCHVELELRDGKLASKQHEPVEDHAQLLLQLETERQYVLGKLSTLKSTTDEYAEFDAKFNELSIRIRELKR